MEVIVINVQRTLSYWCVKINFPTSDHFEMPLWTIASLFRFIHSRFQIFLPRYFFISTFKLHQLIQRTFWKSVLLRIYPRSELCWNRPKMISWSFQSHLCKPNFCSKHFFDFAYFLRYFRGLNKLLTIYITEKE